MPDLRETKRFWRNRLPHWEVIGASFFITFRCEGSLPSEAVRKLSELSQSVLSVEAESDSFAVLQRQMFATAEKFLDSGFGFSPFSDGRLADEFVALMKDWAVESDWALLAFCVMPNHVHILARKKSDQSLDLKSFVARLKGKSSRRLNELLNRTGPFWHSDWFDRWMRTREEEKRVISYIMNNPLKAGIVRGGEVYRFSEKGGAFETREVDAG